MVGMQNNDQRYKVIDHSDLMEFLREDMIDQLRGEEMTRSTLSGENFYTTRNSLLEVCREYLERDPQTDAFLIQYPHGIILEQSKRRFFYRGEKQIYPRSESSLKRKLRQFNNIKDQELYRLVADMRLFEFSRFIDQFQSVREWNRCDVLYELLGQHYGLETNWLDVTNDFSTALFFATCVWDKGRWRPLSHRDIERDECSKWGVIYRKSAARVGLDECMRMGKYIHRLHEPRPLLKDVGSNIPVPIGYQPFVRSFIQSGYAIYDRGAMPLQEDPSFEQYRFEQDPEFSKDIFDMMNGGKRIYPDENLTEALPIIGSIACATSFTKEALNYALTRSHYYRAEDFGVALADLSTFRVDGKPVEINVEHPWKLPRYLRRRVDRLGKTERRIMDSLQMTTRLSPMSRGLEIWAPWTLPECESDRGVLDMDPRMIEDENHMVFTDRFNFRMMYSMMMGELSPY